MNLTEIKNLFQPGQQVKVTRAGNRPLTVNGNTGTTVLPAINGAEIRTLKQVRSGDWIFTRADGRNIYTTHPKASEVMEARHGYLQFRYDNGTVVTIESHNLATVA